MTDDVWSVIKEEVRLRIQAEPTLEPYLNLLVLSQDSLVSAIASIISSKLNSDALSSKDIKNFILDVYKNCDGIAESLEEDLIFFKDNDPACKYYSTPILFYKGFQGLAAYRAANCLWKNDRHTMSLFIQNRASEVFGVDIHPAAEILGGVMIDHATGVVIGETAKIDKNVSIFQGVTLGGKGNERGDRHPKIQSGVSIYASSTVLGNITIGKNSTIAAGSLVLKDVDPNTTVAGIPAKVLST
ncbi:MAG: serine acetyltransferase 2 [SAR86 cluster bacterium SAR86A]|jgi:serine O-acetyltransferase|uniref:Serine acetyltransferase n=1 Tax=SAR86 cluster bacterium SAR86A TaxID=1123866 RepID=J4WT89_9GAMM|nr:MAG: serine acetyltransferase 2 [SAR86 cluster bacterium SAR86A]MAN85083.1 serine O-acetyltransferase [Gammaproteobacteria bacterium]|tara:strand:- start:1342 stop:2070 length:729 start_codon:yes stop_codon:yes gene_type:complete